ncbi:MAG: cation:proton antiporter [Phycisphaerae bacterium]
MTQGSAQALFTLIVLGGAAQWLAWLIRLPSILLLLIFGFLAGPIGGLIDPDKLFGDLLLPIVSFSVALILFEGGLSLNFGELRGSAGVVRNLVTVGALATWVVAAVAAHLIIGLDWSLAILLGAVLMVTGPTVVLPLLRHIKPRGPAGPILKWEGIVIDPIGASMAVLVFEIILGGRPDEAPGHVAWALAKTVLAGGGLGLVAALLLVLLLRRRAVPDFLETTVTFMLVLSAFAASNSIQPESGLLAVTVMGIALANQQKVDLEHIVEFKENLRVFLLSALFILLSARLQLRDLERIGMETLLFIVVLIVVARPLCVAVSTIFSNVGWRDRLLIMWMAPRGIVAAAVSSVFALALENAGYAQARLLVPITFAVIAGSVVFYGLTVSPVARRLKLAETDPQGLLILGAGRFARELGRAVKAAGFRVLLVDTNRDHVNEAHMAGLNAWHGSILADEVLDRIDLWGIGRLLAMTPNDEVNALAVQRFRRIFGPAGVLQLPSRLGKDGKPLSRKQIVGRTPFSPGSTLSSLEAALSEGAILKTTRLTEEFDMAALRGHYAEGVLPLVIVRDSSRAIIPTEDSTTTPKPGQTVISLVRKPTSPRPEQPQKSASPV